MKITDSMVSFHRPIDSSDPGFRIAGHTLRWVSGRVSEINTGRPWVIVRKEDMPPKLLEHIKRFHPNAFADGGAFRRGGTELHLSLASDEAKNELRETIDEKTQHYAESIKRSPSGKSAKGSYSKVLESKDEDVTTEMVSRFKSKQE